MHTRGKDNAVAVHHSVCVCGGGTSYKDSLHILFNICMGILPAYYVVHHMCACAHGDQKRVSDPLKLELQLALSCPMGAGN